MAGLRDNREDLYDVNGNYVGQGGQGMVTQPGADPSDGGHAQVVKAGVEKLEDDAANLQNGVAQVKGALPGWSRGGRSSLAGAAAVGRKVADIAQANGNTAAPAADAVKSAAPEAQSTQPDVAASGTILGGVSTPAMRVAATRYALKGGDAEREFGDKLQEGERLRSSVEGKMSGTSDGTSGQTARQELREKQKAEIDAENAKKTEEAVKREEADKSLTNGGHQPTITETQLQTEKNANSQSSETGNSRDGVTSQNTDAANAAGTADPKFTTGGSAAMNTVSDEDYTSAQQRIADAKKSGKIPEQKDEETVWLHDNPRPVQPEMPDLEKFTESQPPKLKDIDESYRTAYAIMAERIKAAGDDPASKAKRAKARRAQVLVAALGDLLQAAANMWGAAGGATSAKLSSVTAGVGRRHATEDAAELKREAQRAKDLEQMVRRGEKLTAAENKQIMELWKAGENARKYNISERNKAILAEYGKRNEAWGKDYASWLRRFEKIGKDNASARREANTFARQKAMEDYRQRNREKNQATSHRNALARKGAPSYSDLHKSSGKEDTLA